ncbi:hypothetical protein HF325_001464 [Metschnikowia pulcherrima]|uniref:Uncharacterized protein n=1 Tax=Metschnikowia pulcherrima TaxID=27326 RepID=A0A8H7LBK5_9ASCO|nr:hypothetical protein HF325_001464 [Metschnikowia pulcherrima]
MPAAINVTDLLPREFYWVLSVLRVLGILSLLVWLFAQLPQVLENYANQSVAGVSAAFLACWIAGDVTNLIGCLLTRALPFQTCLAAYYCFIDLILSIQYWYYTIIYPRQRVHHNMLQSPDMMRPVKLNGSVKGMLSSRLNRFEALPNPHMQRSSSSKRGPRRPRRSFLQQVLSGSVISTAFGKASARPVDGVNIESQAENWSVYARLLVNTLLAYLATIGHSATLLGTYSGWLSTGCYISSRAPQIWKNYRAKLTSGMTPFLFLFAMTGNILYTVSIASDLYLLSKYDEYLGDADFHAVLSGQMPFLIGSSGTVLFDAVLLFQFWLYIKPQQHATTAKPPSFQILSSLPKEIMKDDALHFTKPDWYTNNLHTAIGQGYSYEEFQQMQQRHENEMHKKNILESLFRMSGRCSLTPTLSHRKGLSGTFNAFARSVANSPILRSPSMSSAIGSAQNASAPGTALLPSIIGTYSSISKKMAHDLKMPFSPIDFLHDDFLHRSGSLVNGPHPATLA